MKKLLVDNDFDRDVLLEAFRAALIHSLANKPRGSQARIAETSGISTGQLTNIIKGIRPGSEVKRRQIALSLGYDYEDFLSMGKRLMQKSAKGKKAGGGKKVAATPMPTLTAEDALLLEKAHKLLLKKGAKAKALREFLSGIK